MIVFRREGLRMLQWYLLAFLLWVFLGVLAVAFAIALLPVQSWSLGKAIFLIAVLFLSFPAVKTALGLMSWIRNFRENFIAIDQLGLRMRIPGASETSLGWQEVTAVRYERRWMTLEAFFQIRCRLDTYTISTTGAPVTFSAIDIPSPKRAAHEIASRIGSEIIDAPAQ